MSDNLWNDQGILTKKKLKWILDDICQYRMAAGNKSPPPGKQLGGLESGGIYANGVRRFSSC